MFTYGSICSGIEAASVAWGEFAKPLWFAEIEPFPSAVLAYRYPEIPNLGDITALPVKILNREIPAPDVLVGGTPCQAFSVAGKRESLDDERGNLTLTLIHILEAIDYVRQKNGQPPCVLVWENVPGVLSTKDNAFGHLLAGLAQECQPLQPPRGKWTNAGYVHSKRTACWRVLDAQHFGVPQRRKRVFLVASARKRSIAQILIERHHCQRDIKSCGEIRNSLTKIIPDSAIKPYQPMLFEIKGKEAVRISNSLIFPTLKARMGTGGGNVPCVFYPPTVRKLTPVECERLQGFPDNWTQIPYRNRPLANCPDSPRYKAIGNSMAVPVMRWIGERLSAYIQYG